MESRIFIVGAGVVGTATGEGLLAEGHEVTFVDVSAARVRQLRERGRDARRELDLRGERPAFVFLTLPTPHEGRCYDLGPFAEGTAAVGRALGQTAGSGVVHTVVVRSTVPPGTTEGLIQRVLDEHAQGVSYRLAANPEFLRAVSAATDFRNPWMTVVASRDARTAAELRELLVPFGGEIRVFTDPAQAEFVKCAHNIFNATKISFWNEMWLVAQEIGLELDPVARTVARSAEGSINPDYGIRGGAPYGGACLPKDTYGFLGFADRLGVTMPLLDAVTETNERMRILEESSRSELLDDVTSVGAAAVSAVGA